MAALAIVAVVSAAFIVVSAAHDAGHAGDGAACGKMHGPQAIVFAISAGSMNGENMTFSIPATARVMKDDRVKVTIFDKPLQGVCNKSRGIGKISAANFMPSTSRTDFLNNSSIPVAGATVVVALEDLNMTHRHDGNKSCHCQVIAPVAAIGRAIGKVIGHAIAMAGGIPSSSARS